MELAEDGMTLTQCDYTASEPKKGNTHAVGRLYTFLSQTNVLRWRARETERVLMS